ncbi:Polar amino acid ABC transporter permease (arginine) [Sodalis praecaptivus]|uniref:Polar amino acid ABC transporter permease (Arginine) n=1 Tax=Sodalis praecaptivus TaxID=1239307 RepID=W0HTA0_9GAMM|nr:amino acid ABC transporter permease [Sodalis praecaptivus]AHF75762.1 Polar amino acid ABC transporter permease (arginine) [Sodalis praecaptivus]
MASQFDWQYILDNLPDLFAGWLMTLRLSLISIVISMLLGAILASMQLAAPNGKIAALIKGYVAFIRNTPLLLQIFFIYFGLPEVGLKLSPFNSGILALSLWAIAFNSENFRAGLAAVPHGLNEASQALGLSSLLYHVLVAWPLALRIALPSLLYTAIGVVKNSSYMQVVGIAELTFVAVDKVSLEFKTVEMFSAITIIYILTVFLLSMLLRLMETRMNRPFARG